MHTSTSTSTSFLPILCFVPYGSFSQPWFHTLSDALSRLTPYPTKSSQSTTKKAENISQLLSFNNAYSTKCYRLNVLAFYTNAKMFGFNKQAIFKMMIYFPLTSIFASTAVWYHLNPQDVQIKVYLLNYIFTAGVWTANKCSFVVTIRFMLAQYKVLCSILHDVRWPVDQHASTIMEHDTLKRRECVWKLTASFYYYSYFVLFFCVVVWRQCNVP